MQNSPANVLPIAGQPLPECDIDAPFKAAGRGEFDYADIEYNRSVREAIAAGHTTEADLYRSLGVVCSFATNFDSMSEPYQPKIRWEGRRSPTPDDLTPADLDTVALLRAKSAVPLLRARLGDILWVRKRDHTAAKAAAADYLDAGKTCLTAEDWVFGVKWFQRAMQLGHRLGRKNEAWLLAESGTVAALTSPLAQTEPFFASHFMSALEQLVTSDPSAIARQAKAHAEKAAAEGDARRCRIYYGHEAKFWADAKNLENEKVARLAAAMTYEDEAHHSLKRNPPSYFAASDSLAHGIEALRRAHADPVLVERLKALLRKYQQESLKAMKTYSHEVDLAPAAEQAAKLVNHPDLREALKALVFCRPLTNPEEVRAEVLKQANDFPLSHMFGASMLDQAGRVTEHIDGLIGTDAGGEEAIEGRMFRYAADFPWKFRSIGFIEPARRQIWIQHVPQQNALDFLVLNNPFVPPGHEGIFRRGLYYGLCGDMLLAAHLLAPQVENSIRYVLEQSGVDVTNLESDLTQPVKTLGPLLTLPQMTEIFGPECVFELRGLLIEKLGYSFRHRVAHGFVSEGECYGPACSNLWWLVLRLCYSPLIWSSESAPGSSDAPSPATD